MTLVLSILAWFILILSIISLVFSARFVGQDRGTYTWGNWWWSAVVSVAVLAVAGRVIGWY